MQTRKPDRLTLENWGDSFLYAKFKADAGAAQCNLKDATFCVLKTLVFLQEFSIVVVINTLLIYISRIQWRHKGPGCSNICDAIKLANSEMTPRKLAWNILIFLSQLYISVKTWQNLVTGGLGTHRVHNWEAFNSFLPNHNAQILKTGLSSA